MDQDDLNLIEEQLREIENKKKELELKQSQLKAQLEAERIEREKNAKFVVTINSVITTEDSKEVNVSFSHDIYNVHDTNIRNILNSIPKRKDYASGSYIFNFFGFATSLRELVQLANVEINYGSVEIQNAIDSYLSMPSLSVSLLKKDLEIIVKEGAHGVYYQWPYKVSGLTANRIGRSKYHVPTNQAWLLITALAGLDDVHWTEEALTFAENQVRQREELNNIALLEDVPDLDGKLLPPYTLRNFQKVGVKFIEAAGGNAILADDVGLGKTVQAIAVAKRNNWKVLIVCPAKLVPNWDRNIYQFTKESTDILTSTVPQQSDIIRIMTEKKQFTIISLSTINRGHKYKDKETGEEVTNWEWVRWLNLAKFDMVILDEGHKIKDTDSKASIAVRMLKCPRFLVMTATPIMNRPGEFWPILTLVRPELFPSHQGFVNQYTLDGKVTRNMEEFKELMRGIMIRRKRSQVQKDLPPVQRIPDIHTLSADALVRYKKALANVYAAIDSAGNRWEQEIPNILVQIMRLKQICAMDKAESTAELAIELYDGSEGDSHRKVLIFSQFTQDPDCVPAIARMLGNEALWFTGKSAPDMYERMRIIKRFTEDDSIHFLVASAKAADEGLDITAAGHVIFNDLMWTPMAHHQCEGRAYGRESDPHSINSYYRYAKDTIETWIQELLDSKLQMFGTMVEGVEDSRLNVNIANEVIKRLKMGRR